jgi:hypothetical protein
MWVTENDTASLIIIGRKANLFFSESNLESLSKLFVKLSGRITVAIKSP